jgi:hypothetical protein
MTACSTTANDVAGALGDVADATTSPSEDRLSDGEGAGEKKEGGSPAPEPRGTEGWRVMRPQPDVNTVDAS